MRILVASSNPKKLEWFKFSLGDLGMDILSLKDAGYSLKCEEDGDSFKTNSVIKAIEALLAFEPNEFIVVSDDGGININSYHNYGLGIYTARTGKTPYELAYSILSELNGSSIVVSRDRSVVFKGAESLAWYGNDGKIHFRSVEGESQREELMVAHRKPEDLPTNATLSDAIEVVNSYAYNGRNVLLSELDTMEYMEVTGLIPLQTSIRRWIKYDILPSLK